EDGEADGDGAGAELDRVALQRAKMRGLVARVLQLLGVGGVEAGGVAAESEAEGAGLGGGAEGFVEVRPVEGEGAEVGGGGGHSSGVGCVGPKLTSSRGRAWSGELAGARPAMCSEDVIALDAARRDPPADRRRSEGGVHGVTDARVAVSGVRRPVRAE